MYLGMREALTDPRDRNRWRCRRIADYLWMRDVEEQWAAVARDRSPRR